MVAGIDADAPGGAVTKGGQRRQFGLDVVKARAECLQQPFVWLSADCDTPSRAAARVKLPSRAMVRKACRSSSWLIDEICS
jgi:hypothetical protein